MGYAKVVFLGVACWCTSVVMMVHCVLAIGLQRTARSSVLSPSLCCSALSPLYCCCVLLFCVLSCRPDVALQLGWAITCKINEQKLLGKQVKYQLKA